MIRSGNKPWNTELSCSVEWTLSRRLIQIKRHLRSMRADFILSSGSSKLNLGAIDRLRPLPTERRRMFTLLSPIDPWPEEGASSSSPSPSRSSVTTSTTTRIKSRSPLEILLRTSRHRGIRGSGRLICEIISPKYVEVFECQAKVGFSWHCYSLASWNIFLRPISSA